ncbi:MAG: NADH:ubiquinone reductase (Na(+)-transporting) subunit C [Candidatus Marinimicrobia bacterium]|nr:NADH:ubiquinone reductase (Na(+)-transporting) subunit C [Candidatus Neomarinimicrobiota bacterium]MCF7839236.1 NADH:ubiquinone reductase (Na(+)-transporting) subunit C [Candidatus Neomarinimicrobiota bacterium]MCF7903234.1 NADH:ubiquinone reductase (Na(+)-transporting) subunit C [Candidatus Neomarinimicrobiota bacterium]
MYSNAYILRFAAIITIVCGVLLASAATLLKPMQQENIQTDIKKNILKAVSLLDTEREYSKLEILDLFDQRMTSIVVNPGGEVLPGLKAEDVNPAEEPDLLPIYLLKDDADEVLAYCIPIDGKGLWSTIHGYLALESDLITVRGVTFYDHGETPGLGGEISQQWFQDNFTGKKILDESENLVSVTIAKGQVRDDAKGKEHLVDGISGATLTGDGINKFLREDLGRYNPYFDKLRNQDQNEVVS